ncbi:hypothetical protein POSPLADRAFT_1139166 [Postia placenta MAD-698-R-SB12]|uniref:HNH nuclease domain-containing protein n=1 Tax=Postia placenta MAD-698-R-SB12 TaxID=670580 RepID=A0A1X6N4Z5_9APHY|nr:hypothetical protein POSPLADRAFT_1139166 [Postia placenta MAD-698-R-SB12]OSX63675.1 hypothetical protein POSPLADRAFT_1139166 [Postia placenta MAD-698-R-SB12]
MWHGLTSTSSCGVTALMGPEALDQDKRSKLKAVKPDGESCGSNLKLYAAYLAPTGSRCLLSLQDAKSVQGCHVVPRRTDDDTCARVAAWWGLDEFDVDSPFNIFLWHLMFVPEPHIVKDHLARSIVPIGGASSLAELFAASDVPVYRYCVVAHRDLPETEESAAFPRDIKILGYVESPIPPQLVIYKWGMPSTSATESIMKRSKFFVICWLSSNDTQPKIRPAKFRVSLPKVTFRSSCLNRQNQEIHVFLSRSWPENSTDVQGPARPGLKAGATAWLEAAWACQNLRPGLDRRLRLGPARLKLRPRLVSKETTLKKLDLSGR